EFVRAHALDIYELFIKRSLASLNELVEEVLVPSQLNALKALEVALRELGQDADTREIMHKLAVAYFMNIQQEIPSVNDFVSAAGWAGAKHGVVRNLKDSVEEIASRYEASLEGMKPFVDDLSSLYEEMMGSFDEPMANVVYDIGTDPRPTEKGLWETAMTTAG